MAQIPPDVPDEKAVYCCDMMSTGFMAAENAEIRLEERLLRSSRSVP